MVKKKKQTVCDICGGTGQVSYFKGVSRFLLSTEECAECAGTGYKLDITEETEANKEERIKRKK